MDKETNLITAIKVDANKALNVSERRTCSRKSLVFVYVVLLSSFVARSINMRRVQFRLNSQPKFKWQISLQAKGTEGMAITSRRLFW